MILIENVFLRGILKSGIHSDLHQGEGKWQLIGADPRHRYTEQKYNGTQH